MATSRRPINRPPDINSSDQCCPQPRHRRDATSDLYDTDILGWSGQQGRLLRHLAEGGRINSNELTPSMRQKIDVANLYADALAGLPEKMDGPVPMPGPTERLAELLAVDPALYNQLGSAFRLPGDDYRAGALPSRSDSAAVNTGFQSLMWRSMSAAISLVFPAAASSMSW
jgi:hypothetical protein